MNLEWKQFPLILLGVSVGAGIGWFATFMFEPGRSPDLRWMGAIFGGLAGLGSVTVTIIARAARDPDVGPAKYFRQINGMGSLLLAHSEPRKDGSYQAHDVDDGRRSARRLADKQPWPVTQTITPQQTPLDNNQTLRKVSRRRYRASLNYRAEGS
jgi:hypothetical protein